MKRIILLTASGLCFLQPALAQQHRSCGIHHVLETKEAGFPGFAANVAAQRHTVFAGADAMKLQRHSAGKTTNANDTIPVVFHIILNSTQITQLGGVAGVLARANSQIAAINKDFNALNPDSANIPSVFKPVFGNAGIHFGLAHIDPSGNSTPGYEIIPISSIQTDTVGFNAVNYDYAAAKYNSATHTAAHANAWDVNTYLNVWIINPLGSTGEDEGLLGITTPYSFTTAAIPVWQGGSPANEMGICLNYGAYGAKTTSGQYFISGINKGRTLTHELGHFFEIWHTWGDDDGLCPNNGGYDDDIADTPPETDANYYSPTFPLYDNCSNSTTNGVMFMNYMDYVDDAAMYMFTIDQAAVMQSSLASETHSLTTHPSVLYYPAPSAISAIEKNNAFTVFPNPAHGLVSVSFGVVPEGLQSIQLFNMMGQEVSRQRAVTGQNTYSFDLSNNSKGIYLVQCTFAGGNVTKKIVLQ